MAFKKHPHIILDGLSEKQPFFDVLSLTFEEIKFAVDKKVFNIQKMNGIIQVMKN